MKQGVLMSKSEDTYWLVYSPYVPFVTFAETKIQYCVDKDPYCSDKLISFVEVLTAVS